MRVASSFVILAGLFAGSLSIIGGQTAPKTNAADIVNTYCSTCHNGTMRSPSGALLDQFDTARITEKPDVWARAYRQLQAGTMPPVGAPRPDRAAYDAVLATIEQASGATAKPPATATSQEIADQLAALLWNSAPDASLLQDAQRNRLGEPAVLESQIHRMLADDRSQAFVTRFFFPWLGLDKLAAADPDKKLFPDYDISLRDAFAKETELFLLHQIRDDRDPVELWSARYTFLNDQLARHYNIPNVEGPEFRMVTLRSPERAGLLGQGSVLMVTSRHRQGADAAYTSPAARAIWVRLHFLGAPQPMPLPNAPNVKPDSPITPQTRALPVVPCVTCHQNFFPLGYALENFDPIGRWRTQDQAGPVDASGTFVDGTPFNGVVELRNVLLQYPEAFRTTITEGLLIYASGKPLNSRTPDTLIRARQILRSVPNPRWSAIIASIVREKN
jgi:Protein of unknown function (DUF1592)/Protein of unknown function (DUF1588)/Protein of unknown function (DUF1585)